MNQASESQELSKTLPPIPPERAEIIWEQWKYRHEFFWKAFYVVTVTTAVISTIPLLKTDILSALSWVSLAFPVTGFAFGWFARGLLDAEYKRLGVVGDSFSTSPWSFDTSRVPPVPHRRRQAGWRTVEASYACGAYSPAIVRCAGRSGHPCPDGVFAKHPCRTKQSSEREPADSLRDKSNVIGGWLPSLTSNVSRHHVHERPHP